MNEPAVSLHQHIILMARMIIVGEDLKLVQALGKFYPAFLRYGDLGVNDLVNELNDPAWSRDIVHDRLQSLTQAGYLEKEHYRAWRLNVDKILSLNRSRT